MKRLLIIWSVSIILISCENEEILNANLEYQELTVVQSEIIADRYFTYVRITKTLPVGVPYDISVAEIKDAVLYLRINEIQIVPLHYKSEGKYEPLYDLFIDSGDYIELFGQLNGKNFYSKTKVPYVPRVTSAVLDRSGWFAQAQIEPRVEEAYAALWGINDGSITRPEAFFNAVLPQAGSPNSVVLVRTAKFPEQFQAPYYNGKRFIQIYAFDPAFERYYSTMGLSQEINNPFLQGSGRTEWNIVGEKVIGLFIGSNKTDFIILP